MGKSEQFRFWSLVIGICLVIGIWLLGFVIGGCGQGQRALEESNYTSLIVSPATATLSVGETKRFVVSGLVKASSVTTNEVIWAVTGGIGTIDATGVFTATAEGSGTIEARAGDLKGSAMVTVTGGKTITGQVTDFTSKDPLPGALVYAGGKTTTTDSSGNFTLQGVSLDTNSVTVQLGDYTPITIYSSDETINMELSLIPDEWGNFGYRNPYNSTINGEVRDENGTLQSGTVYFQHKYYATTRYLSSGKFSIGCYIDPKKLPMEAFLSYGTSSKAGIKRIVIQSTGAIDAGTLEVNSNVGTVTGEVNISYETYQYSPGYISCRIMDNEGRFNPGYGSSSLSSSKTYTIYLPPNPTSKKYYLKAEGYSTDYTTTSQYVENFEIASGESKVVNFSLPGFITAESPANGATSISTTPVFSWTPPDPKFNLYIVWLLEGGGSTYLKWIGVTDKTSITYPSFASGSGFENLNLDSNKGYTWWVYGYYIPGFNLQTNSVRLAGILGSAPSGPRIFSVGNTVKAAAIAEINQALEQTMSQAIYFSTSSIPHVTTTTTSTTSTTSTTTTTLGEGSL